LSNMADEHVDGDSSRMAPPGLDAEATPALSLRVVSSPADFDALEPAWTRLHEESGASVFQSYEWQRTWWDEVGCRAGHHELFIVVLELVERVVAIAPLFVERVPILPFVKLRRLTFLGTGMTDYLDVLLAKGSERPCLVRIAEYLAERRQVYDMLALCDIPDSAPTHLLLFEALRDNGFEANRFANEQCPRLALKSTWKDTLASMAGEHRRQLSKRLRQMREHFAVELQICGREKDLDEDIDDFIRMHQGRWNSVGKKGVFAERHVADFQRKVARRFFRRGWLFLAFLCVDGRRIAALCGFEHNRVLSYYLNGMDECGNARKYSPGLVLHCLCMEEVIRRGAIVYDFMRGTERYKYEFGAKDVANWTLVAFPSGASLAKFKSSAALLNESLARRTSHEKLALQHHLETHGFFSRETVRYLAEHAETTLRDGLVKVRAPEKSLAAATAAAGPVDSGAMPTEARSREAGTAHPTRPDRPPKLLFAAYMAGGNATILQNLRDCIDERTDVTSSWVPVEMDSESRNLNRKTPRRRSLIPGTVRNSLLTARAIRSLESDGKDFDAAYFFQYTICALLWRFRQRVPYIVAMDGTPLWYFQNGLSYAQPEFDPKSTVTQLRQRLIRQVYQQAFHLLPLSFSLRDSLVEDYGIRPECMTVVPPGINLRLFARPDRRARLSEGRPLRLLFVGADFQRKGGDLLVRLAEQAEFRDVQFNFVTKAYQGPKLGNVCVWDKMTANSDPMIRLYEESDMFVLPTRADSHAIATLEAMAMGLPVITTPVGGVVDVVEEGETGYLVAKDDIDTLADRINRLRHSVDLRIDMGIRGCKRVESRFNADTIAETVVAILKRAAASRTH
jgi:CelD/BcsL family acetyltransferase involved in cellulose biosynthesis/glycosyltransferase involved in cell wall biosynthesis